MGVDPPKGVLLFGPPGTGKTLCARAIANRTNACFILVIGSQLIRKYNGEGSKIVREIFELAKQKKACIIFFDEINAIGCARLDDGEGGNNEVQRIMLELINQLDGFDSRGNIKVTYFSDKRSYNEELFKFKKITYSFFLKKFIEKKDLIFPKKMSLPPLFVSLGNLILICLIR